MAETDQERNEEATQTRRDEYRDRGQVAQTRELGSVLVLLGTALLLWFLGRFFLLQMMEIVSQALHSFIVPAARDGDYLPAVKFFVTKGALVAFPLVGILCLISMASTVLQTGFLYNEEALELKFERLNPVDGFMKLLSLKSLVEGAKSIFKLIAIVSVVYMIARGQLTKIPTLADYNIQQLLSFVSLMTVRLLAGVGLFMAVIAGADYFFQWWDLEKQMRMTKQEIKEEHKSREGDPMIKARIRRIQREMANKRMMTEVPKADVIVTNPTHIACALKYDGTMIAPKLLAKGSGHIAEKIKEIARENGVPIVENKPLARTIFKTLKVGQMIPRELFTAVAQVLSYVYKLKRKVLT